MSEVIIGVATICLLITGFVSMAIAIDRAGAGPWLSIAMASFVLFCIGGITMAGFQVEREEGFCQLRGMERISVRRSSGVVCVDQSGRMYNFPQPTK